MASGVQVKKLKRQQNGEEVEVLGRKGGDSSSVGYFCERNQI